MLSKKNKDMLAQHSADKRQTFKLKKLSVGIVSVAVGSFLILGTQTDVYAEEMNDNSGIETSIEEEIIEEEPEQVIGEEETNNQQVLAASQVEETIPGETVPYSTVEMEEGEYGARALDHIKELSEGIGQRIAGTESEREAGDYIANEFEELGYEVTEQEFDFTNRHSDEVLQSRNIIAVKPNANKKQLIVGAHYDSVSTPGSLGAADNGSGVGVMLEVAERVFNLPINYTIKFIAFGAEEVGLKGSSYYANQMSQEEIDNTIGMINLDTLLGGDFMYLYSGDEKNVWLRDQIFELNKKKFDFPIKTNPGLNPDYPAGTTGDWSDHAPFMKLDIPVVYFESTNWTVGALDGYDQTEEFGPIMHSERDNLAFLEANMPGHIEENLSTFSHILYAALANLDDPNTPEDETPPAEDEATPPIEDETTPPAEDEATPPIEDETTPPAEDSKQDNDKIIDDIMDVITEDTAADDVTSKNVANDDKEVYVTHVADKKEKAKEIEAERLPDTATSTWVLGLTGVSLVI